MSGSRERRLFDVPTGWLAIIVVLAGIALVLWLVGAAESRWVAHWPIGG